MDIIWYWDQKGVSFLQQHKDQNLSLVPKPFHKRVQAYFFKYNDTLVTNTELISNVIKWGFIDSKSYLSPLGGKIDIRTDKTKSVGWDSTIYSIKVYILNKW